MAKGLATLRLRHALRQAQVANGPVSAPRFTRRRLLGSALAAGGLGLAPSMALGRIGNPRIAIIGAGIAGLNAAWQLRKEGLEATVYEARNRVGGRMLSRVGVIEPGIVERHRRLARQHRPCRPPRTSQGVRSRPLRPPERCRPAECARNRLVRGQAQRG